MKSLIKKCIVFCMLLSVQNLSFAVARGGMRGGGATFHGGEAGRGGFEHAGGNFNRGNFNRGNFSHNNINTFHGGNNFYGGYRGGVGYGAPYLGGGPMQTSYPDYSQQQEINQLQEEVTELQNR